MFTPSNIETKRPSTKDARPRRSLARKSGSTKIWSNVSPPSRTTSSGYLTITIRRCTHLSRFHIFHHQLVFHHQLGNSKSYRLR